MVWIQPYGHTKFLARASNRMEIFLLLFLSPEWSTKGVPLTKMIFAEGTSFKITNFSYFILEIPFQDVFAKLKGFNFIVSRSKVFCVSTLH